MEKIDDRYIEAAIKSLIPTLGIKESVDHEKLTDLVRSKKIQQAIQEIARCLGLPINVKLSYVPAEYSPNSKVHFQSSDLVNTDWKGRGTQSITAQVLIPKNLPIFGTKAFHNFPIEVRVSEISARNASTFVGVMGHELSHIVLYSLWHKERDNEIYTDLTAMILGLSKVMWLGRKVTTTKQDTERREMETTTYGYLTDDQFEFAYAED
jgi:hypothetical protein